MKKIITNSLITLLVLGGASVAFAETYGAMASTSAEASVSTTKETPKPVPSLLERLRMGLGIQKEIKEVKMEAKQNIQEVRVQAREDIKDIRGNKASSTSERKGEIKDIRMQAKENVRDIREKMASSTKEMRGEEMKERVANIFDKTTSRLEATIVREESIMAKIVARIGIIKTAGGKTAVAEGLVAEAKTDFTNARVALDNLKALIATGNVGVSGTGSTSPRVMNDALSKIRKAGGEVEKDIKAGHKALIKAVSSLMKLPQDRQNATSTSVKVGEESKVNSY